VLLLLVEPHRHERGEVAVVLVVAEEHLRRGQRRPLGDRVLLDRERLLVRDLQPDFELRVTGFSETLDVVVRAIDPTAKKRVPEDLEENSSEAQQDGAGGGES
jgi:hypothetical protein